MAPADVVQRHAIAQTAAQQGHPPPEVGHDAGDAIGAQLAVQPLGAPQAGLEQVRLLRRHAVVPHRLSECKGSASFSRSQ